MRLLETSTKKLSSFIDTTAPDFVILSHRWATPSDGEVTFQDLHNTAFEDLEQSKPEGYRKIQGACQKALQDGYQWIWIDSCCIDRTSSAELQESLNSMWNYYSRANICYAYLSDVPDQCADPEIFGQSNWWTRGWTLQELLAPGNVEFFARNWDYIGTRNERAQQIACVTRIRHSILAQALSVEGVTVAERLSWAAHRHVLREEDHAYALLGLFQVYMPLHYGEGRIRAFLRLQEAIYAATNDTSLFLFRYSPSKGRQSLLAESADMFCPSSSCHECLLHNIRCLPNDSAYENVHLRSVWYYQPRETLVSSMVLGHQMSTTTFDIIEYVAVRERLYFMGDKPSSEEPVSHVAVLNCTLYSPLTSGLTSRLRAGGSALCILLFRVHGNGYYRVPLFPAFLPRAADHKPHQTRLLIMGPVNKSDDFTAVTFEVVGLSEAPELSSPTSSAIAFVRRQPHQFVAAAPERVSGINMEAVKYPDLSFTANLENPWDARITVKLRKYDDKWSFEHVVVRDRNNGSEQRLYKRKYQIVERCSFSSPNGGRLGLSLKRQRGAARGQDTTGGSIIYKVIFDFQGFAWNGADVKGRDL